MGPLLVLVCPWIRENVLATCKIVSFLCNLDNLLLKNVIVFFVGSQISKWGSFEKRAVFDLLFTFFSHQGKNKKNTSAHISLTYIHVFCSPYGLFCPTNSPLSQYERPAGLRLPVPHVSTKPLKSSLSLHAKILFYIWNERIKYCKRYHYEVNRSVLHVNC